ncbi:muscle M-line assembly protein unc-89-like [Pimephales promelas]|uniref:muscle M-line assembly protein unc-89-like n=1 Tax=Pimephales promelas TaxID=90988 RepID=UPI001955A203|nr:muscle M-line assembly protein unc-89-like [Pimephales promelas]
MSLLEKIEGHGEDGTEFPFTAPCLFGRKLDCDNHIQLPQVSVEHRKIELNENNELILTNLSSVNPTRINGHVINQSEQLKHGDLITIIDRAFRFDPSPKTLTAGQDKTVQALQEQQEKSTPVHPEKRKSLHSFDTCLRDGSNLPPSVDQSVENDPFSELYQISSTKKTDIVAKSPWKSELPMTPLARPQVDHEEAPAADVKYSPEPVTPPEPDIEVILSWLDECFTGPALPQSLFPANQEEKPADYMPSVGSVTPSLTEKGVTPVSQKKRTPLKTPQKFSAGEVVQQILSEPQSEEKTPKSPEGRRSVGSQDQSLDLQMPFDEPQTPGPIGKNTEVKMSPRTSPRSNASKRFEVQDAPHEIKATTSSPKNGNELQVRTAEFIKMRAEHSHLFTGDKNLANKAWGVVLRKMCLQGKYTPRKAARKWDYLKTQYEDCIRKGKRAKPWQWFALMDKVFHFELASSPKHTPDSSSAVHGEDEEEPRPPPAKRKRGHVDELVKISDESTQSPTQTQANTPQPGSPDSPYVPSLFTPKTSRRTLALERTAEEDQPCVLNGINSKPDEVEHFLLSLAGPLRHLPPCRRSEVKIKFQQTLHEAEFNNK